MAQADLAARETDGPHADRGLPALHVEHVSKRFGKVHAVTDVSLAVHPGEVVGLIGPNGAGKSTLLSMCAGLLVPDEGACQIAGVPALAAGGMARKNLGFVAGDTKLFARLTVRETLQLFARLFDVPRAGRTARVEAMLARFDLADLAKRRCDGLSSGQAQRVNLARALVHDPSVVILDEPTAALDILSQSVVLDTVRAARAAGKAVLFSSHILGEIEALADRVVFLAKGRVALEGSTSALLAQAGPGGLGALFRARLAAPARTSPRAPDAAQARGEDAV